MFWLIYVFLGCSHFDSSWFSGPLWPSPSGFHQIKMRGGQTSSPSPEEPQPVTPRWVLQQTDRLTQQLNKNFQLKPSVCSGDQSFAHWPNSGGPSSSSGVLLVSVVVDVSPEVGAAVGWDSPAEGRLEFEVRSSERVWVLPVGDPLQEESRSRATQRSPAMVTLCCRSSSLNTQPSWPPSAAPSSSPLCELLPFTQKKKVHVTGGPLFWLKNLNRNRTIFKTLMGGVKQLRLVQ